MSFHLLILVVVSDGDGMAEKESGKETYFSDRERESGEERKG